MGPQAAAMLPALRAEREAASGFARLLEDEQQALAAGDVERLPGFVAEKSRRMVELQRLASRRTGIVAQSGFGAGQAGMAAWIASQPAADRRQITAEWQALLALAGNAQNLNNVNGIIIKARLKHNQQALATLTRAAGTMSVYGRDGGTRMLVSARELGTA